MREIKTTIGTTIYESYLYHATNKCITVRYNIKDTDSEGWCPPHKMTVVHREDLPNTRCIYEKYNFIENFHNQFITTLTTKNNTNERPI